MVATALVFLDWVTKRIAISYLKSEGSIQVFHDFFRLSYVENTGAAFGNFQGNNTFLKFFTFFCIFFLFYLIKNSSRTERIGYWLILSGAVGNLIDRFSKGFVIDFLDFDFFNIRIPSFWIIKGGLLERWPVFNLADSYIFVGTCLVIFVLWMEKSVEKRVKN